METQVDCLLTRDDVDKLKESSLKSFLNNNILE